MAHYPSRSCPNCRTPLAEGQRFCSNCGTVFDAGVVRPTEKSSSEHETRQGSSTPPPPPNTGYGTPPPGASYSQAPYGNTPQFAQSGYGAASPQSGQPSPGFQPPVGGYQPPPVYATPQRDASGRVLRQFGCGMVLIIVLIVAVCGGSIYGVIWYFNNALRSNAHTTMDNTTTGNTTDGNGNTVNPVVTKLNAANATFTYASVKVTLLDIQRSNVVRLDFKEESTAAHTARYLYSEVFTLVLPNGNTLTSIKEENFEGPDPGVKRQNWAEFKDVPASIQVNQLTLRVGQPTEAQMDIPLSGTADISKYADKAITPNKQTNYAGTVWTLTQATRQLSYDAGQAKKDQMFIVVKLKIENNSPDDFYGDYGSWSFLRLKSGDTTAPPAFGCTMPVPVAKGTNGSGECVFAMPQGVTDFTLLLNAVSATVGPATSFQFQIA